MDFYKLTDGEIKAAFRRIAWASNSQDEVNQKAKAELGCPYTAAVSYHHSSHGKMWMGMVFSPRGNTISF